MRLFPFLIALAVLGGLVSQGRRPTAASRPGTRTCAAQSAQPASLRPARNAEACALAARALLAKPPRELARAAASLQAFASSGLMQALDETSTKELHAYLRWEIRRLGPAAAADWLHALSGLAVSLIPADEAGLAIFASEWLAAVALKDPLVTVSPSSASASSDSPVPLAFASETDSTGHVLSSTDTLPAGCSKVFGVFETPADMPRQALAVWRNLGTGQVVSQQIVTLRPESGSNYVWLSTAEALPAGHWNLDLFDPHSNFQKLIATGEFNTTASVRQHP